MKILYFCALLGLLACGDETNPDPKTNNNTIGQTTATTSGMTISEFGLDARPTNTNCVAPPRSPLDTTVELTEGNVVSPEVKDFFQSSQGEFWFDVNAKGTVSRSKLGAERSTFLNIRARVYYVLNSELGLLGAAIGPEKKFIYVHYTAGSAGNVRSVISRFSMGETVADRNTEEILLEIPQPMAHNNGGHLRFGPNGLLYIGMGDGGDPNGEFNLLAQKTDNLLGKILRIDPSTTPYTIPSDNPFANGGGEPEIFAYGFQNPTRLNFDKETGDLWISDTGKRFQELNLVKPGGNYGWSIKVADGCSQICEPIAWQDPAFTHLTGPEDERIIGGSVYRGSKSLDLRGTFVYAERVSGKIFGVFADALGAPRSMEIATVAGGVTQIAQSRDGEMYILGTEGQLYEITGPTASNETLPLLLSQTGCVDPEDPTKVDQGMIPYAPVAPFYSDDTDKERYFSIPEGKKVVIEPNGDWTLPPGSVTLKHFLKDDKIFETRFFVRHDDESYSGYTYRWEGDDAKLIRGSFQEDIGGQKWQFPSRAQCMACHTEGAGGILGLESGQLDSVYTYESTGKRANQLKTLINIGVADKGVRVERLPDPFGSDPLDARARSYLHTNCAGCHRADQEIKMLDFDLTYSGFFGGLCNEDPLFGDDGVGAKRLVPGDKDKSLLYRVLTERDSNTMPPLGNNLVDDPGVALIGEWIDGLEDCP